MGYVICYQHFFFINRELTRPFEASRGPRQGDPMSPYILAMVMKYLRRTLDDLAHHKQFNYRSMCNRLKITYLSFTDGLLLISRGDLTSVTVLYENFSVFSSASGLQANLAENVAYFGGVADAEKVLIQQRLGYSYGDLPFKYLRVPLSTKKLSILQWQPLFDQITAKIAYWTAKKLAYAGE